MKVAALPLILVAAALAMLAVACGDDDDDDGAATPTPTVQGSAGGARTPSGEETEEAATPTPRGSSAGESMTTQTITAADFSFSPSEITTTAGAQQWTLDNQGSTTHTFTIYEDEDYSQPLNGVGEGSGEVPAGDSFEFDFTIDAGSYFARCEIHPTQMEATIEVE